MFLCRRNTPKRKRPSCKLNVERLEVRDQPATAAPGLEVTTYFAYTAGAVNGPTDIAFGNGGLFGDDLYFTDNSARRLYRLNDANNDHDAADAGEGTLLYQFPIGSVDRPQNLIFGNGVGTWGNELYLVDDGPNSIFRISDNTGSFAISTLTTFTFGIPTPTGAAYTPDGQFLLVSDCQNFTVFGGGSDGRIYRVSQTGVLTLWATGGNLPNGLWDNNSQAATTSDGWFTVGHNTIGGTSGPAQIVQFRDNNGDSDALDAGEGRVLVSSNVPGLNKKQFAFDAHDVLYVPGGNKVFRLEDLNHDGDYFDTPANAFDAGESTIVLDAIAGSILGLRVGPDGALYVGVRETATKGVVYRLADGQAPAPPSTPDLDAASDLGTSDADNTTADNTPAFTGTAEPGSAVILHSDSAGQIGAATTDAAGNWSITASALADGTHQITATATDAAGNVSGASAALTITIDTLQPEAPAITSPADGAATDDTTPTLTGHAEPGAMVEVFAEALSLGTTQADAAGAWSFTAGELPEGAYAFAASATDAAGNTSSASATTNVVIVVNEPPMADAGGPYSVSEGSGTTLDGSDSADTDGTLVSYEWDFDYDGANFDVDATGAAPIFSAVGLDGPGGRNIALRVTDDDGAPSAVATSSVTISNVLPSGSADHATVTVNEGAVANNTGMYDDPADPVSLSASVGTVIDAGDGAWNWSWDTSDGPADNQTVTIYGDDADGSGPVVIASFDLLVDNLVPTASIAGPAAGLRGQVLSFNLGASDASSADQAAGFHYSIDWNGDDIEDETIDGPDPTAVQHAFAVAGPTTVIVTATDKDHGVSSAVHLTLDVILPVTFSVGPEQINLNGNGVFPVTLLSTSSFLVTNLDLATLRLSGAAAVHASFSDLDNDGDLDLKLHFRRQDFADEYAAALLADLADGTLDDNHQNVTLTLTGKTTSGADILGAAIVDMFMTGKKLEELLNSLGY